MSPPTSTAPGHVILFGKEPREGWVKTRLQPRLGPDGATGLYRAFLSDTVARIGAEHGLSLTIAADIGPESSDDADPRPIEQSAPFLAALAEAHGADLVAQPPGDLGQRMAITLKTAVTQTGKPAILIGTDLPTLPMAHLYDAFRSLSSRDWVFGPTCDGGYYLVGAAPSALDHWQMDSNRLFTNIPWSTPAVLHRCLSRADRLSVALVSTWYDVDEPDDLDTLARHLARTDTPALPHTREALKEQGRC